MEELKHIVGYEILQGKVLNALIFPIAWNFRDEARKNKGYLYGYLHDGNDYGDKDFKPEMKDGFLKAYLWALRNPMHNKYYQGHKPHNEVNFKGTATCKHKCSAGMWRTYTTETGSRNGDIIDFDKSIFGEQDITFDIVYEDGTKIDGYRRSSCMPQRIGDRIFVKSRRIGYENGLMQSSLNTRRFKGKENIEGFDRWARQKWIETKY